MMNNCEQLRRIRAITEPVCHTHGVELLDARFHCHSGLVLRIFIERREADTNRGSGVSLTECEAVSRDLLVALEVSEGLAPIGEYRLEVSSPGLDRPLFELQDFKRFVGQEVRIQTAMPVAKRKRFRGRLVAVEKEDVLIMQDGVKVAVPYREISKANICYRFEDSTGAQKTARRVQR